MIYLDSSATTPVHRAVLEAMWPFLSTEFGNPSSRHEVGERAKRALVDARARFAASFGAKASEVVFTAGGTESNNLAIKGIALGNPRGRHIVTTVIEHPAVLASCEYLERLHGFSISRVGVDSTGLVKLDDVAAALRADTALVSVMLANNEVGTVQPIRAIGALAHSVGALMHTDAVQGTGWLDLSLAGLGVDAITIAGHKFGAPKGIGALVVRSGVVLEPLVHGGAQERGLRSGTENVAGAVGIAMALEIAEASRVGRGAVGEAFSAPAATAAIRDRFIQGILDAVPIASLTGHPSLRLPSIASFVFAGLSGETILVELERRGILVSSGSACAAGSDQPSPVLIAMGLPAELAQTAVRFSLDASTSDAQLNLVVAAVAEVTGAALGNIG